jgi:CubicO group peptidase (beta-lactamase class C family)
MIEALADQAFLPARAAIAGRRIPGAALGVVTRGGGRAVRVAGAAQLQPDRREMTRGTWFDLASLTKVMFTTPRILALAEAGRLDLDAALAAVIPDLRQYDLAAPERRLTARQCLGHQTHLPAVAPIYTYGSDPATLRAFVLQHPWRPGPPVYSDIGFILLGIVLERLEGMGLLDMPTDSGLSFRPDPAVCAATEHCTWRGRVLVGEVHDENAFALRGAGHAGLFGTVDAVLDFAAALLEGRAASAAAIRLMRTPVAGHRSHGWELSHPGWSGGAGTSPGSIGHTGFTGTGLWIDFDRGLAWTLLTNRVHPSRHADSGIAALRIATGEAVLS